MLLKMPAKLPLPAGLGALAVPAAGAVLRLLPLVEVPRLRRDASMNVVC